MTARPLQKRFLWLVLCCATVAQAVFAATAANTAQKTASQPPTPAQVSAEWQSVLPPAAPPYYRVRYAPGAVPGELSYGVSYTLWLPPGGRPLRGVIVHQHGCGEGACKGGATAAYDLHWQALAARHDCALLGPSYEQPEKLACGDWSDPRNGSERRFRQALEALARETGRAELARVPWALWGHSGGALWAGTMLLLHPERVVAVWLRSGSPGLVVSGVQDASPLPISPAAAAVPVMFNPGVKEKTHERFGRLWKVGLDFMKDFRARGGRIGFAPDPRTLHECGDSRTLAIPFLDACLTARLPAAPGGKLRPMPSTGAWYAPDPVDGLAGSPQPADEFKGDRAAATWLPDARVARVWEEYVRTGSVGDTTPPPAPTGVRLEAGGRLFWKAEADFESGLAGFIIERDGVELARLPAKPVGRFGRPLFQTMSYHDTPEQPLPAMAFADPAPRPGARYRVIAINGAGLTSAPSAP